MLNQRQTAFVAAYLTHGNATRAAIEAGYAAKNADVTGPRLLENVGVREAIDSAQASALDAAGVTAERVRRELAAIAFADIRDVVTWTRGEDGSALRVSLRDSASLSDAQAAGVSEVRATPDGGHIIKMCDKLRALELLMRDLGMVARRSTCPRRGS